MPQMWLIYKINKTVHITSDSSNKTPLHRPLMVLFKHQSRTHYSHKTRKEPFHNDSTQVLFKSEREGLISIVPQLVLHTETSMSAAVNSWQKHAKNENMCNPSRELQTKMPNLNVWEPDQPVSTENSSFYDIMRRKHWTSNTTYPGEHVQNGYNLERAGKLKRVKLYSFWQIACLLFDNEQISRILAHATTYTLCFSRVQATLSSLQRVNKHGLLKIRNCGL